VNGEAGFRKAVRLGRGVGRVVVYFVAPIAERLEQGPTIWMHRGLCEEDEVRGILVKHRDDVDQRGVVGPCLLSVDGEEFEPNGCRERVRSMSRNCVLVCTSRGREVGKVRGGGIPVARFLEGKYGRGRQVTVMVQRQGAST